MSYVCPNIDTDAFRLKCRAPLFPNQWQCWKIARTNVDNPTSQDIVSGVHWALRFWFTNILPRGQNPVVAPYDSLEITPNPPNDDLVLIASSRDKERLNCSDYLISLQHNPSGKPIEIWVEFVYRGNHKDMPWPCYRVERTLSYAIEDFCPVGGQYVVEQIFQRKAPREVPKQPNLIDIDVPSVIDPTKSLTGILFWGGVGVVGTYIIADRIFGK